MLDNVQVDDLFEELLKQYGYDFRDYSRASVLRRVSRFMTHTRLPDLHSLKLATLKDPQFFEYFLQEITVNVTEMFRDPSFFLALRQKVVPILSTYPYIKIWDAGCSTGEEIFSLAILLKEENLLKRTRIYATDINQKVLRQAKEGIFPMAHMVHYTKNYQKAGGKYSLSDYYHAHHGGAIFDSTLLENIIFYPHNLATDESFNEFHLIICRNVLIYFNKQLQERVFGLFLKSLAPLGYLGLGKKESVLFAAKPEFFESIDKEEKIYRRTY
ncbi:protein-glutamate O-methyltransferase CheR [Rhodocytophaga aerolata]|uniref:Protein-glutamate O-methyltransferase CheR n=1 Tax=Rhodocytophaga aerolata TaxID=455078 RepID=A0ABT8R2H4_9BACT|nr:protein-glutamate O-methyltransferase CheR [Rhodocytophaga aerolata]MDO1445841.1 protein-glutamate O-methyltransferase CheR [Rhodocytophaga aerolata]